MNEKTINAITEYSSITSALASVEKYRGLVCDVTTPKGMPEFVVVTAAIRAYFERQKRRAA